MGTQAKNQKIKKDFIETILVLIEKTQTDYDTICEMMFTYCNEKMIFNILYCDLVEKLSEYEQGDFFYELMDWLNCMAFKDVNSGIVQLDGFIENKNSEYIEQQDNGCGYDEVIGNLD